MLLPLLRSAFLLAEKVNLQADGLVSILAHELIETVTDPDGDAWYDAKGQENADKVSFFTLLQLCLSCESFLVLL